MIIAKALNARGLATARGGAWAPVQVTSVLQRTLWPLATKNGKLITGFSRKLPIPHNVECSSTTLCHLDGVRSAP